MKAAKQLIALAQSTDPYRNAPANLAELQLEAARELFAERRKQIVVLDKRAKEAGVGEIKSFADLVPLLFSHTNFKSYPEQFIDNGKWANMNAWLQTLSTYPTAKIDVSGVNDVDDWLERLHENGHYVFSSSGTSGKSSFLNQSAADRQNCIDACVHAFHLSHPTVVPNKDRVVFSLWPNKGTHKMIPATEASYALLCAPGQHYRPSNDPLRAMQTIRPAQLRRKIAAGTARPEELAAYEAEVAALQARRQVEMDAWYDKLAEKRHEPLVLAMMWPGMYQAVLALKARGVKAGDFHPETILKVGGGVKGAKLPPDYRQQIQDFVGLTPERVCETYGMVEMSGLNPYLHAVKGYALAPWIIPLILDKAGEKLLNPEGGVGLVEGRMAFFDILADAHWGGIISGDKVRLDFGSGQDGVVTPILREVARYSDLEEGEDKLSCAGTIDSYVRGAMNEAA